MRAGEVLEPAIQLVCKDIKYGKILIQTSEETGEPQVRLSKKINPVIGHVCFLLVTFCTSSYKPSRTLCDPL